jgi:hypothetical protein
MAEAKKMMDNPEFVKQMQQLTKSKEFKESMKKTQDMLSDPNVAAQAEAKFEHMQRVGNDQLKKNAKNSMEQVMDAMNDPAMKAEMAKMLKDPNFKENLAKMAKSPEFQSYIEAMQDMLKDPATKKKIESASDSIRAQL